MGFSNVFHSREKIRRREASMSSMTEARNLTAQATISPAMRAVIMPPKPKGNTHNSLMRVS